MVSNIHDNIDRHVDLYCVDYFFVFFSQVSPQNKKGQSDQTGENTKVITNHGFK